MSSKIYLKRINFWINNRCTLRCRLCGSGISYFKESARYDMTISDFRQTLQVVFGIGNKTGIIDNVDTIEINGGEPMLNDGLPEIIEETLKYVKHFKKIRISTNGTIIPSKRLLDVLMNHKNRVGIYLSDYGIHSKKSFDIQEILNSLGIECIYIKYHGENMHYDGWVDMGDFSARGRTKDELCNLFSKCPLGTSDGGCWPVWNGKLDICARSLCGTEQGFILSKQNTDYIDIFDTTINNNRNALLNIMSCSYVTACDYCSGDFGTKDPKKRHRPAEQIV
jgi:hypothetical protein